jgi:hypothetical protein
MQDGWKVKKEMTVEWKKVQKWNKELIRIYPLNFLFSFYFLILLYPRKVNKNKMQT